MMPEVLLAWRGRSEGKPVCGFALLAVWKMEAPPRAATLELLPLPTLSHESLSATRFRLLGERDAKRHPIHIHQPPDAMHPPVKKSPMSVIWNWP
jgi:hypothetical protein